MIICWLCLSVGLLVDANHGLPSDRERIARIYSGDELLTGNNVQYADAETMKKVQAK